MRNLMLLFIAVTHLAGQTLVLKAARLFDGRSEALTQPGVVVVTGNRITAVGANAAVPEGARVVDLGDATLMPGLMDAHTHIASGGMEDSRRRTLERLQKPVAQRALEAAANARVTLMAGFTTIRDLGSQEQIDVGLRNAIESGAVPGPRILAAVRSVGTTGGHCDGSNGFAPGILADRPEESYNVADGPDGIRRAVRMNVKNGADVIKVCATGGVLSLNNDVDSPQLTQEEMNALVDQAHAMGKKAAAHAHGAEGAKRAIRAGIDSVEHGSFLDSEALDLMKQKGTIYIPTLLALESLKEPAAKGTLDPRQLMKVRAAERMLDETFRSALARGVRIGFGTDAGVFRHGRNGEEFELLVARGMKPVDALRAATSLDAELFGIADRLGSLEAGKLADIVAVAGNPLTDIKQMRQILLVVKDGQIVRLDRK